MKFGETPLTGLSRELLEETGLFIKESNLLDFLSHTTTYKTANGKAEEIYHFGTIYKVIIDESKGELKKDGDNQDSEGAKWMKLSDLNGNELSPFALKTIKSISL